MTPQSRGKAPRAGPRCSRTCAAPRGRGSAPPRRGRGNAAGGNGQRAQKESKLEQDGAAAVVTRFPRAAAAALRSRAPLSGHPGKPSLRERERKGREKRGALTLL